ncbi:hypothetical protein ACFFGH_16120 [Lysobacter korlensis]|uniref:Uncharacterized protein n=1 Tax=Lysobacter korlensis TaxID=553636 RepID=A0ABV6RSI7_9GAMM
MLTLGALAIALAGQPLHAQETPTHVYRGVVKHVVGPQTSAIKVGDPVVVSYRLDTSVPDSFANDPRSGYYAGATAHLGVSLPASGLDVAGGKGAGSVVQTFDNTRSQNDQISIRTAAIVRPDTLQGLVVNALEYNIISETAAPNETPDMLQSDALPVGQLLGHDHVVHINTSAGWTNFLVALDPAEAPTVAELVEEAVVLLDRGMRSGAIKPGTAKSLALKFEQVLDAYESGNTSKACSKLRTIDTRVRKSILTRCMTSALGRELLALTAAIRQTGGAC